MINYKDLQKSELNDTYTVVSKLYTPSTINIEKELLFGQIENGLVSGRLATSTCSKLDFNPEFLIQFKMYFHPNNLRSERNNS